jgi:protein-S-isoprenylcysteine O-methyltransferase Ste14
MFTLALLWLCWCTLHSLLITGRLNAWINKKGGFLRGSYRIVYILFSIFSLIPVLWYQYALPQKLLFAWQGWWRLPQFCLLLYALVLFWYGKKNYDMDYFLGLTQWRQYRRGKSPRILPFRCAGVLQYVRHPWYSGGIALLWALGPITDAGLLGKSILSVYLIIGTMLEERKLKRELGEVYKRYCQQVPMLIPWKGKVSFKG